MFHFLENRVAVTLSKLKDSRMISSTEGYINWYGKVKNTGIFDLKVIILICCPMYKT